MKVFHCSDSWKFNQTWSPFQKRIFLNSIFGGDFLLFFRVKIEKITVYHFFDNHNTVKFHEYFFHMQGYESPNSDYCNTICRRISEFEFCDFVSGNEYCLINFMVTELIEFLYRNKTVSKRNTFYWPIEGF